jgi:starch synthase
MEDALRALARQWPQRVSVAIGYDESLAHLIEAGADMFLMPSRFEPCGLNQMYSQRYGTPPVARATGGLADTIVDCNRATLADGSATGFLIDEPSAAALIVAVRRALEIFCDRPRWRALQLAGMARDFGWESAAGQYALIYRRAARLD